MFEMSSLSKLFNKSPYQVWCFLLRKMLGRERLHKFDDKHRCVFVLSTGRVGTQTLAFLLKLGRGIYAYHEPKPYLYALSKLSYQYCTDPAALEILCEAFLIARHEKLNYALSCDKGYVETSPQVTFLAPAILAVVPSVRFIHLVRDPRDVVRSGMRRHWYDGNSYDKTRISPHPDSLAGQQWENYDTFQKNLWLWVETNRWILDFSMGLRERVLLVQAENIFNASEEILEDLFDFVGITMPSERKIQRVLHKKLNAQKRGAFPQVSEWSVEMRSNLIAIAGDIAGQLGYDL
jgi:hypothetical protein